MLRVASHGKATIYIYSLKKVSKNPRIYCIFSNLPKNTMSRFGLLGPLGVKQKLVDELTIILFAMKDFKFTINIGVNPKTQGL